MKTKLQILRQIIIGDWMYLINWVSDGNGVFANLTKVLEWIYCVKRDTRFGIHLNFKLFVNLNQDSGFQGNLLTVLFKEFEDYQIFTIPTKHQIIFQTDFYPKIFPHFVSYPTDGMKHFNASKFVYRNIALFDDPDFSIFRNRLQPIASHYLQPNTVLQKNIDLALEKINVPLNETATSTAQTTSHQSYYKIGIHVRCLEHFPGYPKSSNQFLEDLERDVDQIMQSKDPNTTVIFLATLLEPVVKCISSKYNVVVTDIPRTNDVWLDWGAMPNANNFEIPCNAIVDAWCLANCDELWCGSSNMAIFTGCLNPNLKIHLLPCLKNFNGT